MTGRRELHHVPLTIVGIVIGALVSTSSSLGEGTQAGHSDFAALAGERIDAGVRAGKLDKLHAVVAVRGGEVVLERYYAGKDERWGDPLGRVEFDAETLHDLRSVSKSIVGLLYGIALEERKVPPPEEPLLAHLPRYADLRDDARRTRITVADALTMQLGLEWDESLPYSDLRNSEIAMEFAPDRCRYVLERPIVAEPGTTWTYSGGATALLACLTTDGTRMTLLDYAREKLFSPLGIEHVEWVTGRDGAEAAASGLRMRPRDLAAIGALLLDGGEHNGTHIVPKRWIDASFKHHARIDDNIDYGYHWYVARRWNWYAAFGNGGQRMTLLPRADMVLVVTAGNYNEPDAWKVPVGVLVDAVLPALER